MAGQVTRNLCSQYEDHDSFFQSQFSQAETMHIICEDLICSLIPLSTNEQPVMINKESSSKDLEVRENFFEITKYQYNFPMNPQGKPFHRHFLPAITYSGIQSVLFWCLSHSTFHTISQSFLPFTCGYTGCTQAKHYLKFIEEQKKDLHNLKKEGINFNFKEELNRGFIVNERIGKRKHRINILLLLHSHTNMQNWPVTNINRQSSLKLNILTSIYLTT